MKLPRCHQCHHIAPLIAAKLAGVPIRRYRRIAVNGGQKAVLKSGVPVFGQVGVDALLRNGVQIGVDAFQRLELIQQVGGGLFAHGRHAGDVVRFIADQRLEIGLLRRGQAAVARRQLRLVHNAAVALAARQIHLDQRADQLESIPVAGQDDSFQPVSGGLPAQSANQVVRLVAGQFVHRHGKGAHQLFHPVKLPPQFRRRGRTLRLVVGKPPVPKSGLRRVKSNHHMAGLPFVQGAQEHAGKPVHAGNILPRAGHRKAAVDANRPKRPMHHRMAVNQQQQRGGTADAGPPAGRSGGHQHWHLIVSSHSVHSRAALDRLALD